MHIVLLLLNTVGFSVISWRVFRYIENRPSRETSKVVKVGYPIIVGISDWISLYAMSHLVGEGVVGIYASLLTILIVMLTSAPTFFGKKESKRCAL